MVKTDIPADIDAQLDEAVENTAKSDGDYIPQYRMVGNSRIPISKAEGKLWQTRLNQCTTAMSEIADHWDKAYKYYSIDHVSSKSREEEEALYGSSGYKLAKSNKCKENVIYTNIMGLVPALYAQNPTVTITPNVESEINNTTALLLQRLINVILQKRTAPGINLQPKARKAIINTMITNRGIIKIGWTNRNELNEQVYEDINKIAEQLKTTTDTREIEKLEGQLEALNDMIDLTEASCCFAQHILPTDLFIDPCALEQDGSDAKWMIERTYMPTEWLRAKFGFEHNNETKSVYKPDHILKLDNKTDDNDNENELFSETSHTLEGSEAEKYGYKSIESYKKSQLTECYWVWDKYKRRVLLYSGDEWEYPVWVYEDPYKLEEFFPYYILNFIEAPNNTMAHGEVSFYTDQQDEINLINTQLHKMREFGFNHYLFNTNAGVARQDIEKWANGGNSIVGINLPQGVKFEDVLFSGSVPTDKNQILYDKSDLIRQIDAASGTDATIRNGEYKTNTTNYAIQTYMANKSVKIEDKVDLIEKWLGNIAWGLAQLCLQFMSQENVTEILGQEYAQDWKNYTPEEIKYTFSLTCVGGSTQRPTSASKQQQALQMVQLFGQFASTTPYAIIIALKVLARSFDDFVIKTEDILQIEQSIEQQLQAQQQAQIAQQQQAQAQADLANEQANSEVVNQEVQQQQMNELPESVQNTILNNIMQQPGQQI